MQTDAIQLALHCLQQGQIIAYPTEGVYGLGCDPLQETVVMELLALKQRPVSKGLILIAADWAQLVDYIEVLDDVTMEKIKNTKNTTWLFTKTAKVPDWIAGKHPSIAVRVIQHPIAQVLCQAFGRPIVSTSANISNEPAARDAKEVAALFANTIACIVEGVVGGLGKPTTIRDASTGQIIRR